MILVTAFLSIMTHRLYTCWNLIYLSFYSQWGMTERKKGEINQFQNAERSCLTKHPKLQKSPALWCFFMHWNTSELLTPTPRSPPHLIGWSRPPIGHWGGRRARWQRSQQFPRRVRCLAFDFQLRSRWEGSVFHFPLEDRSAGDLSLQSLKIRGRQLN